MAAVTAATSSSASWQGRVIRPDAAFATMQAPPDEKQVITSAVAPQAATWGEFQPPRFAQTLTAVFEQAAVGVQGRPPGQLATRLRFAIDV
jgi:hypothetical protein